MSDKLATIPDNEFERLLKLSEYDIDYSEIHGKLDDLTKLAAFVTGTPISLVNVLEANFSGPFQIMEWKFRKHPEKKLPVNT